MSRNYLKIQDTDSFVKDPITGALININKKEHDEYIRKKRDLRKQKELASEVQTIKDELSTIKQLLEKVLNKCQDT